ncbi:aminotransferase class IV [Brevibacterium daeguense]|uniref:aminotransferase class IV n=1 Tax=Brevibacterium daeguense TaxID=909936 RepID=UPI001F1A2601
MHDSFLVRAGRVLALDAHISRMAAAIGWERGRVGSEYAELLLAVEAERDSEEHAGTADRVPEEHAGTADRVPEAPGWFFPLVTFDDGALAFQLRPFEPHALRTDASLWTCAEPDTRTAPTLKGPDFPLQHHWRAQAQRAGADEAVLVDRDGFVREGAFSSIVHWRAGALCVAATQERLPSVTEAAVTRAVQADGIPVTRCDARVDEIRSADEVWILSSLHGIRVVHTWDGKPVPAQGRARRYRERLLAMERAASAWLADLEGGTAGGSGGPMMTNRDRLGKEAAG